MRRCSLLLILAACQAEAPVESSVMLIRQLAFEPIVDGVTRGFNLDDADEQCNVPDYTSPDGEAGIDNSFAALLPSINAVGGDALPELLQASVTDGELLLLLEQTPLEDGCTQLSILRGKGKPALGGDGLILPGQTFDVDLTQPHSFIDCADADETSLEGRDYTVRLPLTVFDESIDLTLLGGAMRMEMGEDHNARGIISGGVSVSNLQENVASFDGIPQALHDLFGTALNTNADLLPDDTGACTQLSVVMGFEATPAFIFEDAARP